MPSQAAAIPKIIDVQIVPFAVTSRNLTTVVEPLSLLVQPNGNLIIGDGRQQNAAVPADLVLVDRSNNAAWVETSLLGALLADQNPLVAPTAVYAVMIPISLSWTLASSPMSRRLIPR